MENLNLGTARQSKKPLVLSIHGSTDNIYASVESSKVLYPSFHIQEKAKMNKRCSLIYLWRKFALL